jgi:OPT family oligopeptide transporter
MSNTVGPPNQYSAPNPKSEELPLAGFKGTPEEIDRQWYEQVYKGRGDSMAQLTLRSVLMGGILGMFMAVSNLYTTLKLGWSFGVSITACVVSFVVWNAIRKICGGRLSQMTILENNCMQSTATAAGSSTGATIGTCFGALLLIQGVHQSWLILVPFAMLTAALGVFLAIPMKRQMINQEQLKFPSGIATAETLQSLYSKSVEAMHKAWALIIALAAGGVIGLLRSYSALAEQFTAQGHPQAWLDKLLQKKVCVPEVLDFTGKLNPLAHGHMAGLGFEPSVLLIGAGMITGLRVSLSMLAGSALLYFVIAPQLVSADLAQAGMPDYVPTFKVNAEGNFNPMRWALWGGTSLMVFSSLIQMALNWRTVARAFAIFKKNDQSAHTTAMDAIEVPNSWLIIGMIPITIGLVIVQYLAFQISIGLGLIAVAMSFVASLVCCRATGETDTGPVGAMGKVTQLLYAVLPGAKGVATVNLMAAGVTAASGNASADLLTDLKSGYLLGANPRKQFLAQFCGIFFGVFAVIPAWYAMVPNKAALEAMNPPATNMWKATADLLTQGVHMLPKTAISAIVIGGLVGLLLPVLEKLLPRAQRFLPSAMGLGLSWVVPFQNALSFAIGAAIVFGWQKINRKNSDTFAVPIASGLVAGESLVAAFIAIACTMVGLLFAGK